MKASYISIYQFLVSMILSLTTFCVFAEGGRQGGGTDAAVERQAQIQTLKRYIKGQLANDEINFFKKTPSQKILGISDPSLRNAFAAMLLNNNLIDFIKDHNTEELYNIANFCSRNKDEFAEATLNTPICFNVQKMADRRPFVTKADILRMAIHARAHQFGWAVTNLDEAEHEHDVFSQLPIDEVSPQIFSPPQSVGITACNFITETKNENRVVPISALTEVHEYKKTTNVPKGNCDRLGALNNEVGVNECARIASERKYNCFQVEDMQIKYTVIDNRGVQEIESPVIKSCYACLRN